MTDAAVKKPAEGDQSMEEILQSIRKIIAEESDDPKPDAAAETMGSDVLELTNMLKDDGSVVDLKAESLKEDVLSQIDTALAAPAAEPQAPAPKDETPPPVAMEETPMEKESLVSDQAAASASAAIRQLADQLAVPKAAPAPAVESPSFRSGATLEDLTLEALRPMLKAWLDTNLPALVERIVQKEIRRISEKN